MTLWPTTVTFHPDDIKTDNFQQSYFIIRGHLIKFDSDNIIGVRPFDVWTYLYFSILAYFHYIFVKVNRDFPLLTRNIFICIEQSFTLLLF